MYSSRSNKVVVVHARFALMGKIEALFALTDGGPIAVPLRVLGYRRRVEQLVMHGMRRGQVLQRVGSVEPGVMLGLHRRDLLWIGGGVFELSVRAV